MAKEKTNGDVVHVFGIIIKMNKELSTKHHKPHIHAMHAGKTLSANRRKPLKIAYDKDKQKPVVK